MADLPSSFSTVGDVEGAQDSIVAESQFLKLGSNDNYLKDTLTTAIANRTSGDSTLTTNKNSLKTELNTKLVLFQKQVHTVSIDYLSFYFNTVLFGSLGLNQRVAAVWAEKRAGANTTYVAMQVFADTVDKMIIDQYILVSGLDADDWDTFYWVHEADTNSIRCRFFNNYNVAIP